MRYPLEPGKLENGYHEMYLDIVANGMAQDIMVPVMVMKGGDGPTLGVTAAMHGNELNGLKIVQKLFAELKTLNVRGTVIGVPVMNVPALLNHERYFNDHVDLNRIMPGREGGTMSQVYAHRLIDRIVRHFDVLLDLHTASFGRINSYYIRANMNDPETATLARLQNAEIILNNAGGDGTLRAAANDLGIKSITLEVGDPNRFQKSMIRSGLEGIYNVLSHLGMIEAQIEEEENPAVECNASEWLYTDRGGVLEVKVDITQLVKKGDFLASVKDVFGNLIREYFAPYDGVVIGKSTHPIAQTGSRIVHLGKIQDGTE